MALEKSKIVQDEQVAGHWSCSYRLGFLGVAHKCYLLLLKEQGLCVCKL